MLTLDIIYFYNILHLLIYEVKLKKVHRDTNLKMFLY